MRYLKEISSTTIDRAASHAKGDIFVETEGFMIAIQDEVIAAINYMN